jgi:deoxycytidylate deaminase
VRFYLLRSAIIQSGIKKIYVHEQFYRLSTSINREKWIGHDDMTMQMFDEANVDLVMLDLPHLKVDAYLDGLVYHFGAQ